MKGLTASREVQAALIRDSATMALPLMLILINQYGDELFEMDPVELYVNIEEDFHAQLTEEGENRVQAALLAMTTDQFYKDALSMRSIALALYEGDLGDLVNGVLEDVEFPELLWATYEVGLLRDDDEEFSPEVQRFVDETVRSAADANDDLEEADVLPFYVKFLQETKQEFVEQLIALGVDVSELPEVF